MGDEIYRSNNGKGPLRARILKWQDGWLTLERWNRRRPERRMKFMLPERFWMSDGCGWRIEGTP